MNINHQNYECFLTDYLDGLLEPEKVAELMAFLAANPDLSAELEQVRTAWKLPISEQAPQDFSHLLKDINRLPISSSNFDELCIACHEGDLDDSQKAKLIAFALEEPKRFERFELFSKLKFTANKQVAYFNKRALKQQSKQAIYLRRSIWTGSAIAASIALMLFLRIQEPAYHSPEIASYQSDSLIKMIASENETLSDDKQANTNKVQQTTRLNPDSDQTEISGDILEIQLAAVDTTENNEEQFIKIARIEPQLLMVKPIQLKESPRKNLESYNEPAEKTIPIVNEIKMKSTGFIAQAENLTINDIIRSGINGINKMAETNIQYEIQTNDEGKITEFALKTDNFNLKRKIRSN